MFVTSLSQRFTSPGAYARLHAKKRALVRASQWYMGHIPDFLAWFMRCLSVLQYKLKILYRFWSPSGLFFVIVLTQSFLSSYFLSIASIIPSVIQGLFKIFLFVVLGTFNLQCLSKVNLYVSENLLKVVFPREGINCFSSSIKLFKFLLQ